MSRINSVHNQSAQFLLTSISILPFYLCLILPSDLLSSGFPTKTFKTSHMPPAHCVHIELINRPCDIRVYVCTCIYIYIYMCVCVCVCVLVAFMVLLLDGWTLEWCIGLFMLCTDRRTVQWIATDANNLIPNVIMRINVLISICLRILLELLKFSKAPAQPRRSCSFHS